MGPRRRVLVPVLTAAVFVVLSLPASASSRTEAAGHIDHVESNKGTVQVLFSIEGLPESVQPDLTSAAVDLDGDHVDATATSATGGAGQITRTVVLVIDVSRSMRGDSFAEAKSAARTFIDQAPADVRIGLVSFASTVDTTQAPTLNRTNLRRAVDGLQLSAETHLYDGVMAGLSTAGTEGQRRLLLLTDGQDTTGSPLGTLTTAVRRSGDQVDIVGISVSNTDAAKLAQMAAAGHGTLVNADHATELTKFFSDEAQALAAQLVVSFPVPDSKSGADASLTLGVDAGGVTYSDTAFVSLGDHAGADVASAAPRPASSSALVITKPIMIGAIGAIGVALVLLTAALVGIFRPRREATLEFRLAGYGGNGSAPVPHADSVTIKESAVGLTQKVIGKGGFESKLARKLDTAGLSLKPAEWVLLHAGLAFGAAAIGFLLTSGGGPLTLLFLLAGMLIPWLFLGVQASRRIKAFNAQLSDALQLTAGGLRAGLSLAQSVDTIVREGTEPMAGELRRALVEARLGVDIEDALDGVAQRMSSDDFRWVVMAIRIQRQVGGNLAELMLTVAGTLREREYLRRQVLTLSAEGRLSAWVLGGLPPAFMLFLVLTKGDYVAPMFHTALGWALLVLAVVLLAVGSFWMSKTVRVEV